MPPLSTSADALSPLSLLLDPWLSELHSPPSVPINPLASPPSNFSLSRSPEVPSTHPHTPAPLHPQPPKPYLS